MIKGVTPKVIPVLFPLRYYLKEMTCFPVTIKHAENHCCV